MAETDPVICTFCGKGEDEVRGLVSVKHAAICDECVELAIDILRDGGVEIQNTPPTNADSG